jgi:LysM repeat protein
MKRRFLLCFTLFIAAKALAQDSYNDRAKQYIARYYALAVAEQKRSGIPACITLGQGILETEAGASELMTEANNHFGIKCKNGWQGPTFLHDDDAMGECFKKYASAEESFRDHSDHLLTNPRYKPLFSLSPTDYASWAVCLKKCGYATNPQYALQLIKIIEDFKLQAYTYTALDSSILKNYAVIPALKQPLIVESKPTEAGPLAVAKSDTPKKYPPVTDTVAKISAVREATPIQKTADSARDFIRKEAIAPRAVASADSNKVADTADFVADNHYDSSKIVTLNGLKAFYAYKGDILLQYAVKYHVRYPRLLEINDLADAPLPYDMYIYLDRKLTSGTHADHVVQNGETLFMISQSEGVQLKKLMALNLLAPNEQPITGTVIQLQKPATEKPEVKIIERPAHKENAIITAFSEDPRRNDSYIAIKRPKVDTAASEIAEDGSEPATAQQEEPIAVKPMEKPKEAIAKSGNQTAAKKDENDKELAALKADLDRVVYADDSKLMPRKDEQQPSKAPAPVQARPAPKGDKYYTIKRGDTAFSIAKRNNMSVDELMALNHIDASGIKIGKRIQVRE